MEWCRLYASLDSDPRVQAAEDAAENSAWLLMQSMMYCTAAETQGFIPRTQVPRFGGRNVEGRTKALVSEHIWIPEERGYRLNPDIWSEERNLSDQVERKRQADRERMRVKRAAARETEPPADLSRDSRATGRATRSAIVSRDSRPLEERRGDKHPPQPPAARPLWPAAVPNPGEGEDSVSHPTPADLAALTAEVREIRREWGSRSIRRALENPDLAERGWDRVRAAMLAVAADPDSQAPGRLAHDGPWWNQRATAPPTPPRPAWCGECDEHTRLTGGDQPGRCPRCHPLRAAS